MNLWKIHRESLVYEKQHWKVKDEGKHKRKKIKGEWNRREKTSRSKIYPSGIRDKRVIVYQLHVPNFDAGFTKDVRKKPSAALAQSFVCTRYRSMTTGTRAKQKMCNCVKAVKGFYYLGDRLNASGGSEAAVTARTKNGWVKFRECGELLHCKRFSLRQKRKVYQFCVQSKHGA